MTGGKADEEDLSVESRSESAPSPGNAELPALHTNGDAPVAVAACGAAGWGRELDLGAVRGGISVRLTGLV